jgi:opacity protein-like surface antigen
MQLEKQFGMGKVLAYVAHPSELAGKYQAYKDNKGNLIDTKTDFMKKDFSAWELFLMGKFQFNEQFGFDLGFQAFFGDNAEDTFTGAYAAYDKTKSHADMIKFNDAWTLFAGLRFNFNDNVAFRGIFYHQKHDIDYWLTLPDGTKAQYREWDAINAGYEIPDDANHWRLIVDVKQEALKFTSLWLEYGQYDQGFFAPKGTGAFVVSNASYMNVGSVIPVDTKYFRVGLGQVWNEKWATHEFYYSYDPDIPDGLGMGKMSEWGLGVQYKYNPYVTFGLNFVQADNGVDNNDKDNLVRFRTKVTF